MRAYDIIFKKRLGEKLNSKEMEFMIASYNNGDIADYQMSAFLMASFLNGLDDDETSYLTNAMINSGDILDLSKTAYPTADKHSTGGVGDGTSLIIAPVVASCGVCVPMMAGRALGHTGGTLDKLESIPGFQTNCSKKEFLKYLDYANVAIIGQTQEMAPVDKKMYALRDATACVESIPLICSSIMSKKIAEGANTLVLDVKTGDGAFMQKFSDSKKLAQKMIAVGKRFNRNVIALITDMDTPLGMYTGNALEIKQAIEILKGNLKNDLSELAFTLSEYMLYTSKKVDNLRKAKELVKDAISSGRAIEKFRQMIKMQGGNPKVIDNPDKFLPGAKRMVKIKAKKNGYISKMLTRNIGIASMMIGVGREKIEDKIDYSAGVKFYKKTGDKILCDEIVAEVYCNKDDEKTRLAVKMLEDAYIISNIKPVKTKLIKEILNNG